MLHTLSTDTSEVDVSCSIMSEGGWHFAVGGKSGFTIYRIFQKEGETLDCDANSVKGLESQEPLAALHVVFQVPLHNMWWTPPAHRFRNFRHRNVYEKKVRHTFPPLSPNDVEIMSLADVCDGITHVALFGDFARLALVARPRPMSDGLRRRWKGGGYNCMPSATSVLIAQCVDSTSAQITHEVAVENDVVSIFLSRYVLGVCTSVGWSLYTDPMESSAVKEAHHELFDAEHPSSPQRPPPFVFCAKYDLLLTRSPRSPCGIALYGIKHVLLLPEDTLIVMKHAEEVSALRHAVETAALYVGPQKPHQFPPSLFEPEDLVIRVAASSVKRRVLHVLHLEPQATEAIFSSMRAAIREAELSTKCGVIQHFAPIQEFEWMREERTVIREYAEKQDCVVPFTRLLKQHVCSSYVSNSPRLDQLQFVECGSCIAWLDTQRRHVNLLHGLPTSAPHKTLLASVFGMKAHAGMLRMHETFFEKERLPVDAPLFLCEADRAQPRDLRQDGIMGYPFLKTVTPLTTQKKKVHELPPPSMLCLNCIDCRNGNLLTIREYPQRGEMYASFINHGQLLCLPNDAEDETSRASNKPKYECTQTSEWF